jgi:hypothetical protein
MCCAAEVFSVWVNFISVHPHPTQIQVFCLLFSLIKLLWLWRTTAQSTGFRWVINCAIRSGYGQYNRPLELSTMWRIVYYWSDCFVFEMNLISWNYWVIRGQNLCWVVLWEVYWGLWIEIFVFCAVLLHIHTAVMGYMWCRLENVIKIVCQVWCRCLITWTGNVMSRMAVILNNVYQYSFYVTKTYSCLQKVVVLVKLW